jgi:transmembrane sensor
MSRRESSAEIDLAASAWAARIDRARLTPKQQLEFEGWLGADIRRQGAYARALALLVAVQPAGRPLPEPLPVRNLGPSRRVMIASSGCAAASVAAATALVGGQAFGARYVTKIGEVRLITLADGSVMTLNTASEAHVHMSARARDVRLVRGEALFDVRKDRARPFVVQAGDTRVRAVGTSFSVSHLNDAPIQVLVNEGVVEITHGSASGGGGVTRLAANERAVVSGAAVAVHPVDPVLLPEELAWRQGMISFRGVTLGDAAAQFARYSDMRIQIDDPSVQGETITGLFSASDPAGFAEAAAASLGLRAERLPHAVRLSR